MLTYILQSKHLNCMIQSNKHTITLSTILFLFHKLVTLTGGRAEKSEGGTLGVSSAFSDLFLSLLSLMFQGVVHD